MYNDEFDTMDMDSDVEEDEEETMDDDSVDEDEDFGNYDEED